MIRILRSEGIRRHELLSMVMHSLPADIIHNPVFRLVPLKGARAVGEGRLTELIALNVGLAAGLIDERLFSVLVLMAVMTVVTGPLLTLIGVPKAPEAGRLPTDGEAPPSRLDPYAA